MVRKYFIFISFVVIAAIIYLGWTYFSRQNTSRALIERLEKSQSAKKRDVAEAYHEGRLAILGFYASPGTVRRGEKVKICYSVLNSERVRIEPPIGDVWPSLSRCIDVMPHQDTKYKLFAEDAEGNVKTAEFTITVR